MLQMQLRSDLLLESQNYLSLLMANNFAQVEWAMYFACAF
jgi:hypothetical protein